MLYCAPTRSAIVQIAEPLWAELLEITVAQCSKARLSNRTTSIEARAYAH